MLRKIKNALYFQVAAYFRFFAAIQLRRWSPRVVVITGSNGKTTLLHLIEAQLGSSARYSHHANSTFGIPFNILGLERKSFSVFEWFTFAVLAPFRALKKPPQESVYVVEADCDRPSEGDFLSSLLQPEVTIWLSCARTHSQNFDRLVENGEFKNVEEAIAYEFGYFVETTTRVVMIKPENYLIAAQMPRTHANVVEIPRSILEKYELTPTGTSFTIEGKGYRFSYLLPRENLYAVAAAVRLARYFGLQPNSFASFTMPPGRSSVLLGIKNTAIVDSSYNANSESVKVILELVAELPAATKWLILGDLIEQGYEEKEEHEKVAKLVAAQSFQKVILVGPRMRKYALPLLQGAFAFDAPREALDYLQANIVGGETLIFKGARFLEGVIEHLLADPKDASKLCRREEIWSKRRAQWGL